MILTVAGLDIEVQSSDPELEAAVATLVVGAGLDMPPSTWPEGGTPRVRIRREAGGFQIDDDLSGTLERRQVNGGATLLVTVLEPRLAMAASRARPEFPLHAAGVVTSKGAILALGDSGAGKSSFALACASAGFDLLGDDQVQIDASGRVRAFPRLLKVHGDRLSEHGVDPRATRWYDPDEPEVWYAPEEVGARFACGTHEVRGVALLQRDSGGSGSPEPDVSPLDSTELLQAALLGRAVSDPPDGEQVDRVLAALRTARGVRVAFTDARAAARHILEEFA